VSPGVQLGLEAVDSPPVHKVPCHEEFMKWTLQLPVWEKCGFRPDNAGTVVSMENHHPPPVLDPAKQALRLLAWRLGMKQVAREKKRAIQFGARTAKMQIGKGRKRGTDLIDA
jgi:hypothetical protein